jgi:hippurate hydrolase
MPHKAVDPVVVCAQIVLALQTIVSRNVPPLEMAIITVGAIHAGDAPNVIPEKAQMRLSVRALKPEVRDLLQTRITEVARAQAAVYGAHAEVDYQRRYPVLVNDAQMTAFAKQVALDWVGADNLLPDMQPLTGSEDFAFLLERCAGSYLIIGNGDGEGADGCVVLGAARARVPGLTRAALRAIAQTSARQNKEETPWTHRSKPPHCRRRPPRG